MYLVVDGYVDGFLVEGWCIGVDLFGMLEGYCFLVE